MAAGGQFDGLRPADLPSRRDRTGSRAQGGSRGGGEPGPRRSTCRAALAHHASAYMDRGIVQLWVLYSPRLPDPRVSAEEVYQEHVPQPEDPCRGQSVREWENRGGGSQVGDDHARIEG